MTYGYPYPCSYPVPYPAFPGYSGFGGGFWFAVVIILFILLLLIGGWWWLPRFINRHGLVHIMHKPFFRNLK